MNKEEYLKWLEELENRGYEEHEIEAIVQDYLEQPESPEWFFESEEY